MKNQFVVALLGSVLFLFSYIAQAEEKVLTAEEAAKELANPNTPLASLNYFFTTVVSSLSNCRSLCIFPELRSG